MGIWRESGYADFADGTLGNGGQNLYVSRAGVLQRIFRFDANGDGYADAFFMNSQDMNECPPAYVFADPLNGVRPVELPTYGSYAGAIGDLNGDGYDDLVIGNQNNGTHSDLTAFVYYGGPDGPSERYRLELPVPNCRAVAIGDFDGDGRPDLAFGSAGMLRIFLQGKRGFAPADFVDLNLEVTHLAAGDLDGDGCADLYVRVQGGQPIVLWGGPGGIDLSWSTVVGGPDPSARDIPSSTAGRIDFAEGWAPRIVRLGGVPHLFRPEGEQAGLFPVAPDRTLGAPLRLDCDHAVAAAVGDVDGDGHDDLALAVCPRRSAPASSWIYWGGGDGFAEKRRTALPTLSARDIAVVDLNGDGCAEVVVGQGRTDVADTTESLIFRGAPAGVSPEPVRLITHDATTVLVGRTGDGPAPQVAFVNHSTGRHGGDVSATVYLGGPDGFSPERRLDLPVRGSVDCVCADFDDDGRADLLLINCAENSPHLDPGSFLYWAGPDGFSPDRRLVIPTVRAHGSAVGDFRHSGYLDLVTVGFFNPEMRIFRGGPGGFDLENPQRILLDPELTDFVASRDVVSFTPNPRQAAYWEPRWLLAADFDNDGWLDLFVSQIAGPRCLILWGGPEGFSMDRSTWLEAEGSACAQAADLDGDGYLELIVGGHHCPSKKWNYESYVYIYWGGPEGFREDWRTQLPAHAANSLAVADFNGDGILDIFCTSYNDGRERDTDAFIYWGAPGGHYSAANRTRLFTHSSSGCMAVDFDEDGRVDLAVASHRAYGNHVAHSQVWWNGPEGFSEQRITWLPTVGPHGMVSVDPGNILDRGPEEYYVSSPFQLPEGAKVTAIRWEAEIQKKTWVKAQLRFAANRENLDKAPWQGAGGTAGWLENGQAVGPMGRTGRWVQYRLALGAVNGGNSPRVTGVEVHYE